MTDDQHGQGQGAPQGGGRWDPLPQGDYDDGATAFVKLPEGGIDALLAGRGDSPLAAPGHGYVPPRIAAAPDRPDADGTGTGAWPAPAGGAEWPDPASGSTAGDDRFSYHPGATGQWTFDETPAAPAPGHDVTGQWSIPVAGGDLPDESGEFTTSSLVEQWGGTPPATLPGGAAAPWATAPAPDTVSPSAQPWTREPGTADEAGRAAERARFAADAAAFARELPAAEGGVDAVERREPADGADDAPGAAEGAYRRSEGPYSGSEGGYGDPERLYETETATGARRDTDAARDEDAGWDERPARESDDTGDAGDAEAARDDELVRDAEPIGDAEAADEGRPSADRDATGTADEGPRTESAALRSEAPASDDDTTSSTRVDDEHGTEPGTDPAAGHAAEAPPFHEEHPLASYVLRVNGSDRPVTDAWIGESLLYVLRERLGLAGAKDGCSQGECGACNVQVDGRLVASCLVPAVTTAGSEIRTVEGLAVDGQPSDVQRALARCGAVQCGFCVPGMAMTVHDLLEGNPAPTELETRQALCGNLCRCSGYRGVLRAVEDVVAEREAHAAADAETDGDEARIPHQAGPGAGGVHPSAFENPAQPHPHDPVYGQGQDGGQA
ncbi:2Fe-2S iron-sulfur cluster-binding protein [Streptomyces sp. NPDC002328]|uniref:2Fe-2S iron-sulfur cluster-binding protein n=1 Tax=Streptomyces sp. NPDC002328 TaxID=3364642 RepID=UPI0036CFFD0A